MNIQEYQEKIEHSQENKFFQESIHEMIELFCDLSNQPYVAYYKYEYEYNDYFHQITVNSNGEELKEEINHFDNYKLLLKDSKRVYGYLLIKNKIKYSSLLRKLLKKIIKKLAREHEINKKLSQGEIPFNIYLIHDDLETFANNLKTGLESLFNANIIYDSSIEKHYEHIQTKESKNIIIFLINDLEFIERFSDKLKYLNELIIVIGPNDHHISMSCGKLGIEDYISINDFKAENLKSIIVNKRKILLNKNKFGNRIIALAGIAGGIGTTSIAMNMSDLIAKNVPDKNILYIDLSTTKAISNLFLSGDPLPNKTIIDLINSSEFNLDNNLEHGLVKVRENFYSITGIQKHIDKEFIEKDIFIQKLLEYISSCSDYFNFVIIDLGIADASNLKSTIYDIVNELWIITSMNLPHTSQLKTFYSLMKRAGLRDKISFLANRFDSENTISVTDVISILNMSNDEKDQFERFKIPNDYKSLGRCWNLCELASQKDVNSLFIKKLNSILEEKNFYKSKIKVTTQSGFFSNLFKRDKR
jgi:Flp pilus assembly CpaE family ATPase